MSFSPTAFFCALLIMCSSMLFAQSEKTYSLEIQSLLTDYNNTLGPVVSQSIKDQWQDWQQVDRSESDYHIRVKFLQGLDPKQYRMEKVGTRQYIYDVKYVSPAYETQVLNKSGQVVLQKAYGRTMNISRFGAEDRYASPDTLSEAWRLHRDAFYEIEEAKYNNVDELLENLSVIINSGAAPVVENIETVFEDISPTVSNTPMGENTATEEKVILAVSETEDKAIHSVPPTGNVMTNPTNAQNSPTRPANASSPKEADKTLTPQTPPSSVVLTDTEIKSTEKPQTVETPTPYTKPEPEPSKEEPATVTTPFSNNPTFVGTGTTTNTISETGIPEPQKREPETVTPEKQKETDAERTARLERIQKEWEAMDKADEEKIKTPRVRFVRLGLRTLIPNIVGGHGEVVLPVLHNRVSLVGDFSQLPFGNLIEPFLDEGTNLDDIGATYRYYSFGANYYFSKKYARGWYTGASYLKNIGRTEIKVGTPLKAEADLESVALRFGLNAGRGAFMFGFEVGAGVPLGKLTGGVYSKTDGEIEFDEVDERVPVVPILNVTIGVAL